MKSKIIFVLNYLWCLLIALVFPYSFAWIFLDITGHSKGYDYDLGPEKDFSVMLGFVELLIWLLIALPSNIYEFKRLKNRSKLLVVANIVLYISLAALIILIKFGWYDYLKDVFNI